MLVPGTTEARESFLKFQVRITPKVMNRNKYFGENQFLKVRGNQQIGWHHRPWRASENPLQLMGTAPSPRRKQWFLMKADSRLIHRENENWSRSQVNVSNVGRWLNTVRALEKRYSHYLVRWSLEDSEKPKCSTFFIRMLPSHERYISDTISRKTNVN